jgi:LCP family protein required for cell wall assembly
MKRLFAGFRRLTSINSRASRIALILLIIASLAIIPSSYSLFKRLGSAETGIFGLPLFGNSGAVLSENGNPVSIDSLQSSDPGLPLPDPWDGAERITILVMGLDYRDWSSDTGPAHTDTMILFTIDPVTKTAGMLSVPRDLWTVIPGFTPNKINTAYYYGELYNVPGGGPAVAMRTVEQVIGVPIDYYAQIDFNAFINFIDLIGGVKIDVPEPITVDPLGSDTIPRTLEPGRQVLPGWLALAYARERHAPGGDFARSQRQQQIVIGIRDRILEFDLLPGLIASAGDIFTELSSGINTNLPLDDALRIAVLATQINIDDIKRGVIGEEHILYGESPDELAILIPIPDKIRELRDEIFTSSTALGPLTPGSSEERLAAEAPRVSIQNGTSDSNLLSQTATHLLNLGVNVSETRVASAIYSSTIIVDHTGNPFTMAYLTEWMNITGARIVHELDLNAQYDMELILGNDWLTSHPFP